MNYFPPVNVELLTKLVEQQFQILSTTKNKAFNCALLQVMFFLQSLVVDDEALNNKGQMQGMNDATLAKVLGEIMLYAIQKSSLIQQAVLCLALFCLKETQQNKSAISYTQYCYWELWIVDLLHVVLNKSSVQLEPELKNSLVELGRLNGRSIIWHCKFAGVKEQDIVKSKLFLVRLIRVHSDNFLDLSSKVKQSPVIKSYYLKYTSIITHLGSSANDTAANQTSTLVLPDLSLFTPSTVSYKQWQTSLLELSCFFVDTGIMIYKISDNKRCSLPALVRCRKTGVINRSLSQDTISETTLFEWLNGGAARKDSLLRLSGNLINELDLIRDMFKSFVSHDDPQAYLTDVNLVCGFIIALSSFIKSNLRASLRLLQQSLASRGMTRFSPETLLCEQYAQFSWLADFMFSDRDLL